MTSNWLCQCIEVSRLGIANCYPRDLRSELPFALPVSIVPLERLTTTSVRGWLERRGLRAALPRLERPLHGCLVARAGVGLVFFELSDNADEQRFTLAHEAAHFIHDHLFARERALRALGERIRPVLDGVRSPTREESLSSVLERVPLGLQLHMMARDPRGLISDWSVDESEQRADRLAFELLAPARKALAVIKGTAPEEDAEAGEQGARALANTFGLPLDAAFSYLSLLLGRRRRSSTGTLQLLGLPRRRE